MDNDPLPEPLRGLEIGTFTHHTITVRFSDIARRIPVENNFPPEILTRVENLIAEIPYETVHLLPENAPDTVEWNHYIRPFQNQNWLQVPWFFIETYFFRRILTATGYYQNGPGYQIDPFKAQKQQGLVSSFKRIQKLAFQLQQTLLQPRWDREAFENLLAIDLWGNQADLSLWPAGNGEKPDHESLARANEHLLVNDSFSITDFIENRSSPLEIHFIIDNAGYELVGDLCLADYLLSSHTAAPVCFHVKPHPTYVSDATRLDVMETIAILAADDHEPTKFFGKRLQNHLKNGELILDTHYFWTSPLAAWDLPGDLAATLSKSDLVISKGDANYRRLLGDRHWLPTTPFSAITHYFPTALVALRTCKSGVICGLQPNQADALEFQDPDWQTNGRWGVIQFRA